MNKFALATAFTLLASSALAKPPSGGKTLRVGQQAPVFKLRTLDGAMVRLDELAYTGREKRWSRKRPVLLDFFRTDCSPCRRSMPDLVQFYITHHEQGLDVLLIALLETDDGRAKLEKYLAQNKVPFTVLIDPTEHFAKKYLGQSVALPATFLLDHEGTLMKAKYGAKGTLAEHFDKDVKKAVANVKVLRAGPDKVR